MLAILLLTVCTSTQCEEYVIDYNLTKEDCIERRKEELQDNERRFI